VNSSLGVSRPTSCSPSGTANGDISTIDPTELLTTDLSVAAEKDPFKPPRVDAPGPLGNDTPGPPYQTSVTWGTGQPGSKPTWPTQRLEQLVQELARLDPSLRDTLASQPSPEPPLGLLDGLIPLTEIRAAMRPASREAEEETVGTSEPG
jgi:protein Shroom